MKLRVTVTTWKSPSGEGIPVIVYTDLSGKRRVRKFHNPRDAYKEAEKVEEQLRSGVMADPYMTVSAYVEKYLAAQEAKVQTKRVSKATFTNCYYVLGKHLAGREGSRKFRHLNRPAIRDFLIAYMKDHKPTSAHTALAVIRSMFTVAVSDGMLASNPCSGLGRELGLRASTGEKRALTKEQAGQVLKYAQDKEPDYFLAMCLYLSTGMRLGEGLALKREHFNREARTLHVDGSAGKFGEVTKPKTDLSVRDVEIPKPLADLIHKELSSRVSPWILAPEFLSPDPRGSQITAARARIQGAVKRIGIGIKAPDITPHWLRHTFATLHIEGGSDIAWVSRQLGHASIKTTMDLYGRGAKPKNPGAVDAYNETLMSEAGKAKYRVLRLVL